MTNLSVQQILTIRNIVNRYMHHNCPANSEQFRDLKHIMSTLEELLTLK